MSPATVALLLAFSDAEILAEADRRRRGQKRAVEDHRFSCPNCQSEDLRRATGKAAFRCRRCNVLFSVANPSSLYHGDSTLPTRSVPKFCHDCANFVPAPAGSPDDSPIDTTRLCRLRHRLAFRMPDDDDYHGDTSGFYRRGCKDRVPSKRV